VLPGGIDVHTHLELPFGGTVSSDDFYSGHKAAAFGGTTCHIDFVVQAKGESLHQAVERWHKKSDHKAVVDFGYHMAITDLTPQSAARDIVHAAISASVLRLLRHDPGVRLGDDVERAVAARAGVVAGVGDEQPGAAVEFEGGDVLPVDVAHAGHAQIAAVHAGGIDAVEHGLAAAVVVRPEEARIAARGGDAAGFRDAGRHVAGDLVFLISRRLGAGREEEKTKRGGQKRRSETVEWEKQRSHGDAKGGARCPQRAESKTGGCAANALGTTRSTF